MGTNCDIQVFKNDKKIYRAFQYMDGRPELVGERIAMLLAKLNISNQDPITQYDTLPMINKNFGSIKDFTDSYETDSRYFETENLDNEEKREFMDYTYNLYFETSDDDTIHDKLLATKIYDYKSLIFESSSPSQALNEFYRFSKGWEIEKKLDNGANMKLPIGIQTFEKIREDDYIYIDKTKEALELINTYQYVFLSRPRRFGKSLFVDTLQNIFEGKKENFKGLYIKDKYDFSDAYPVIHISFAGDKRTKEDLNQVFEDIMRYNEQKLGIKCETTQTSSSCFKSLILQAYKKYNKRVVILIDEYDKLILDNIKDRAMAEYSRDTLKDFYEVIKDKDQYIRFVFITGVSKFSKVSLFSGLNNLEDITLSPTFGNICGYTQKDIETSFKPLLRGVDLQELKEWYNGYNFLGDKVYNPYGVLLFVRNNHSFENYWFETATPTFLIDLMKKNNYYLPDMENITVGKEILNSFDIENIDIEVLLFQAGYLTIKKQLPSPRGGVRYSLTIPNKEIRISLSDSILNMFISNYTQRIKNQDNIFYALYDANKDDFYKALISLFASIPYQNYTKNNIQIYEGFYASIIYIYLSSLGLEVTVEESTNQGRLDMSLKLNNNRYIFEFKMDNIHAISQIKEKKYHEKYLSEGSKIYLVGINFSKTDRNVSEFEWEKYL